MPTTHAHKAARTANAVKMLHAIAGKSRRRKMPRKAWPTVDENDYARAARRITVFAVAPPLADLVRRLPSIIAVAKNARRADGIGCVDGIQVLRDVKRIDAGQVRDLVSAMYAQIIARIPVRDVANMSMRFASRVSDHNRRQLSRQLEAALGAKVSIPDARTPAAIDAFIDQNVSLIIDNVERLVGVVEKDITRALASTRLDTAFIRFDAAGERNANVRAIGNVDLIVRGPDADRSALAAAIEDNVAQGGSTAELSEQIQDRFGFTEDHADLIARDQVGKLNGQLDAQRQQDLGVSRFTWRSVGDERVREEHQDRDGEVYEYDDPPDGELPGEPINCVPGDATVSLHAPTRMAYRRWHRGKLTEIVSDSVESIRCTPNHPVLTSRGWLPAHLIQVGDDIVEAPSQGFDGVVANPERSDATAEQMFGAMSSVFVAHRIAAGASWFHGDVTDEQVDVVRIDRLLLLRLIAESNEMVSKNELALAAQAAFGLGHVAASLVALADSANGVMRSLGEPTTFLDAGPRHAQRHRFAASTWFDFVRDKHTANRATSAIESLGDRDLADAASVRSENLRFRKVQSVMSRPFEGFVYNFSTDTSWFGSHGLIVHNCRCSAEPVLDDIFAELEG